MTTDGSKDRFYNLLKNHISSCIVKSIEKVDITRDESGFYDLCKKYADIGLNALKKPAKDNLGVDASFQIDDLERAYEATTEYINKYDISDKDALFDVLRIMHAHAVEEDEKRVQSAIRWDEQSTKSQARVGSYVVFSQLPDELFEEIKEAVITGRKKW